MDYPWDEPSTCFLCERGEAPLLRLCDCKHVHDGCLQQFRAIRVLRGGCEEVLCTGCGRLHASLPCHLSDDAARGVHHLALVQLWLPNGGSRPCAVLSGEAGMDAFRGLIRTVTGEEGPWFITSVCEVHTEGGMTTQPPVVRVRLEGWETWGWGVYCIAMEQARHGTGGHCIEVRHTCAGDRDDIDRASAGVPEAFSVL